MQNRYALVGGSRSVAVDVPRGTRGLCEIETCTDRDLLCKSGDIIKPYWSHSPGAKCDTWAEPNTDWHEQWGSLFPDDWREVVIGNHRADVRTPNGFVVELQHSSISTTEIAEREAFYGDMVWLFDAIEATAAGRLIYFRYNRLFTWKRPWASLAACKKPVLLDCGNDLILECVPWMTPEPPDDRKDQRRELRPLVGYPDFGDPPFPGTGRAHTLTTAAFLAGVKMREFTDFPVFGGA